MRYYFSLQLTRFKRTIANIGVPYPIFCLLYIMCVVIAFKNINTDKIVPYILATLLFIILEKISDREHIKFLAYLFNNKSKFYKVRFLEVLMVALPFLLISFFSSTRWLSPIMGLLISYYTFRKSGVLLNSNKVSPTPFGKYPFEMIRYWRSNLIPNILALFLFIMGIASNNYNLSALGIAIIPLCVIAHLEQTEPYDVLWNYTKSSNKFLLHKITRITLQTYVLTLPLSTILFFYHSEEIILWIPSILHLATFLFIALFILIKYSIYPRRIGLFEMILFCLTALFPILLFLLYPFYYFKAKQNLKSML